MGETGAPRAIQVNIQYLLFEKRRGEFRALNALSLILSFELFNSIFSPDFDVSLCSFSKIRTAYSLNGNSDIFIARASFVCYRFNSNYKKWL